MKRMGDYFRGRWKEWREGKTRNWNQRITSLTCAFILTQACITPAAAGIPYFDTTFGGGDGVATWNGGESDYSKSMIIDSSGILVAGFTDNGGDVTSRIDFALTRFTGEGALDTSFGDGDGVVTWDAGSYEYGYSVATDSSGNIYVGGRSSNGMALVRFTSGGVLDTTFGGGGGVVIWNGGGFTNDAYSITVDTFDNIYLAGSTTSNGYRDFTLVRFTSSGILDTSFGGGDGVVTWDRGGEDWAWCVATDGSGNILLTGSSRAASSGGDFALVRFTSDGVLDTTFGSGDGAAIWDGGAQEGGKSLVIDGSGNIYVAGIGGFSQNGDTYDTVLTRFTSNGVLDTSFGGGDGIVTWNYGTFSDEPSVTMDSFGNILVAGISGGNSYDFALTRVTSNGVIDTGFGDGDGVVTWSSGRNDTASSVITDGFGNIYVAGTSDNGNSNKDFTLIKYFVDIPVDTMVIDGGNLYAHSASVTLSLTALDIYPNVTQMQISNDGNFDTEPWEVYSTSKAWTLTTRDGIKTVYVRFQDNAGMISASYSDAIILDTSTVPADVNDLNATQNDDGSITLYWTTSWRDKVLGQNVYRDEVKINTELIKSTNYIDTNTTIGTTYTYRVTSVNLSGKESSGVTVGVTSAVEGSAPPAAPEGINVENSGAGDSLNVVWVENGETDLNGYKVYWGTETGNYTDSFDVGNLTSYTINGLSAGTLYYIAVTAYDINLNESKKSIEQTATPILIVTKPDSVTDLTVTEGNSYLTLTWNAVIDVSGYMVYIGESDGSYGVPVRTTDTTYTFENLNNGKTYFVAIASYVLEPGHTYTASSVSDRVGSSGTPYDNDPPASPGNLSAADAGISGTVVLSWDRDDNFDIAGYVVSYKKTGDIAFEGIASTGITWSYAVTGLVDNVSYDFNAYSYDASGNFSEPVSVTETSTSSGSSVDVIPPEPPILSALPGDNKVTLHITPPPDDDVDHYNIYIYNIAAGKFMPLSSVNGLIYEENAVVTNGKAFVFVATAVDVSGNESGYSEMVSAVPNELPGDIELEKDPPVIDRVDGYDIVEIANGFGKSIGHPDFNPNADLNGDGMMDGEDVTVLAPNHGKKK